MTAAPDVTPRYLREIIADGACAEAVAWARAYPTAEAMWAACERVDCAVFYVGEDGIEAGVKYRCDAAGKAVRA